MNTIIWLVQINLILCCGELRPLRVDRHAFLVEDILLCNFFLFSSIGFIEKAEDSLITLLHIYIFHILIVFS